MQENPDYLRRQILTYKGNKRDLLKYIGNALNIIHSELGKEKLSLFDAFSGSGIVSRFFKKHASELYSNDLEAYSRVLNECFLANKSEIDWHLLESTLASLKKKIDANLHGGFISELYAPKNDDDIQAGERVFYTVRNANYIDTARQEIAELPQEIQRFFLAPLLVEASIHVNTAGVFKGFYKDYKGIGRFGGEAENALFRIKGEINLELPVLSNFDCDCNVMQMDAKDAAHAIGHTVDLAYLDPPYNQHPYGSNYFMLNTILKYERPREISRVSGIAKGWNRSKYNARLDAQETLFKLIKEIDARYVLISYNSEGFVKYDDFVAFMKKLGKLRVVSTDYATYRGCRNLNDRNLYVKEYLFLLKK